MQHLIKTQSDVDDVCRRLSAESVIGVDTEFMRVRTYFPRLALVQVATRDSIYCIDPLAAGVDLAGLCSVLADSRVCKIMHAARQDVEVLLHTMGVIPAPLFDTQIAAALLGYGDQIGYARLVEAEFGESLPKSVQRTDWTRRPLSEAQLGYAANDVRYLISLYDGLSDRLEELGRLDWAREDFERVLEPDLYETDPDAAYRRVGRGAHLGPRAQHALKRLCAWREKTARSRDLPRNWVADEETLAAIAVSRPGSIQALKGVEGLPRDMIGRDGEAIIDCLSQPAESEAPLWSRRQPLTGEQKAVKAALVDVLRARAGELGIAESVLATRAALEKLARGVPAERVVEGWRWEVVGRDLKRVVEEVAGAEPAPEPGAS